MKALKKLVNKIKAKIIKYGVKIITKLGNIFMNKNQVLFISFDGLSYSDNPKAVSEMLHELRPKTKIVWLFNKPKDVKKQVPKYVKIKKKTKFNLIKYLATSLVWVDNDCLVYKKKVKKHKDQLFIETWHGDRGLKKCFYDVKGYKRKEDFAINSKDYCDYFLTGSTFAEKTVRSMFKYKGTILNSGYPRNDILINGDKEKEKFIKEKLGVEQDANILLYAPTFRGKAEEVSATSLNFKKLIEFLEKRDNKKWVVVLRLHHRMIYLYTGVSTIDGSKNIDMADLLLVADMLITDYSSSVGDFALRGKPIILFCDDYDAYSTKDRGLHFDLENSPFLFAKNNDKLFEIVENLTEEKAKQNCEEILRLYDCYENGTATKQVCDLIITKLNSK